jgi:NADH:ubiquinone oxidoreductase subunit E
VYSKENTKTRLVQKEEFTSDELLAVDSIIARYFSKPGSLILVLEDVQEVLGHLPISIQRRIARGLCVPFSEVYGVVTFYSFFTMTPRGRHTIKCCLGTACYVRGGKRSWKNSQGRWPLNPGTPPPTKDFLWKPFVAWVPVDSRRS